MFRYHCRQKLILFSILTDMDSECSGMKMQHKAQWTTRKIILYCCLSTTFKLSFIHVQFHSLIMSFFYISVMNINLKMYCGSIDYTVFISFINSWSYHKCCIKLSSKNTCMVFDLHLRQINSYSIKSIFVNFLCHKSDIGRSQTIAE